MLAQYALAKEAVSEDRPSWATPAAAGGLLLGLGLFWLGASKWGVAGSGSVGDATVVMTQIGALTAAGSMAGALSGSAALRRH